MTTPPSSPTTPLPGGDLPLLGFGTWQSEGDDAYTSVLHALETGYRHIDTATAYGNEDQVGRAIADSGVPRDDLFVTTKLPPENAGTERETLESSLEKLGLGAVDLWLVHWPPASQASPEVWQRFRELRDEGLARSIGVSNYSPAQIDELVAATGEAPAVDQIPWSPSDYDATLAAELGARGVVLEGYSPFKRTKLEHPTLAQVAATHGVEPAHVVLRWHIDHGFVVIPKSVTPARIESNFRALDFALSADEIALVDALGVATDVADR